MRHILKGRPIADLQREVWSADATPEDLVLWIDENMPREYQDPKDLVAGYEMLSRADMFLGRTRRTQDYGLWAYASELSTLGVSAVRKTEYRGFQNFGFPQYLMRMSRTRGLRQTKDLLAEHLGRATHSSKRRARAETVEPFSMIFQHDVEFARAQTAKMDLTDEELVLLLGNEATAARIKEIRAGQPGTEEVEPGTAKRGKAKGPTATAKLPEPSSPAADDGADESPPPSKPEKPKPAQGQKSLFGF
jgi:replication factor C large subunit